MRMICLVFLLLNATVAALSQQPPAQASYGYDVARTHEIQPHRRTIPIDGVRAGFNQLRLTLILSPSGGVVDAKATGEYWNMEFWPKLREEVLGWKFKPFEKDGEAVKAEVEEYVDLVPPERLPAEARRAPGSSPGFRDRDHLDPEWMFWKLSGLQGDRQHGRDSLRGPPLRGRPRTAYQQGRAE